MQVTNSSDSNLFNQKRIVIPFITTNPLYDVGILVGLIPIWWFLGIESIILPIGFSYIFFKILITRTGSIRAPIVIRWLFAFLLIYIISGLFIIEPIRWISFVRSLSVYLSVFFLFLIINNSVREWKDIEKLIKVIFIVISIVVILGLFALLNLWRPNFNTLFGVVIPGWIAKTNFGSTFVSRSLGNFGYFQLLGRYFRLRGIFTFATLYASALAYTFPLILFFHHIVKSPIWKLIIKLILILSLLNLFFTTGRTAIFSLILGGGYYYFFVRRKYRSLRIIVVYAVFSIILIILTSLFEGIDFYQDSPLSDVTSYLVGGRGASTEHRLTVYQYTIQGWLERPIFGWGTERDIQDFKFPAGSHSYYLSILYRQGSVGIIVFLLMLFSLWKSTRPLSSKYLTPECVIPNRYLEIGRWIFIVAILDGLTTVPITDIVTMTLLWLILSTLVAVRNLCLWPVQKPIRI